MVLKIQKKGKYLIKVHVGYPETDIPAMFTAMSTKRAEPLIGFDANKYNQIKTITKEINGDSLRDILLGKQRYNINKEYLYKHINSIVDQLAEMTADLYLSGVIHGDIMTHNIIITKDKEGKPKLWLIDFETAQMADALSNIQKDYDYVNAYVLERLARSIDEERKLKDLFRKKFEKYILNAKGTPIKEHEKSRELKLEKGNYQTDLPVLIRKPSTEIHLKTEDGQFHVEWRDYGGRRVVEEVAEKLGIKHKGRSTEEVMEDLLKKDSEIIYEFHRRTFEEKGDKILHKDKPFVK